MIKYRSQIIILAATGVGVTALIAYLVLTLGSIASEEDSILVEITDKHIEISFSAAAEPLAFYDLPKKLPLDRVIGVSSEVSLPKAISKIAGTGSNELKSGTFQTERGVEYWFVKDLRYPILTVNITDEKYERLVLEVKNAKELVKGIKEKINKE